MSQTRRLAAILAADVAGYSRLIGADEEGTLNQLRSIRADVIDPKIADHHGRIVKTTGDGLLVEFTSVVDALRCATEVQNAMAERNADAPPASRIEFRMGVNVGDVVVEDGDIFGDGVNVAARLEGLAEPGGICVSARVQEDVAGRLDLTFDDLGEQSLKNIARPVRVYRVRNAAAKSVSGLAPSALPLPDKPSIAVLPFANMSGDTEQEYFADGMVEEIITALSRIRWLFVIARNSSFSLQGTVSRCETGWARIGRPLCPGRFSPQSGWSGPHHCTANRRDDRHPSLGRPVRRLAGRCLRASGQSRSQRCRCHRASIASRRDPPICRSSDNRPQRLRFLSAGSCDHLAGNERAAFRGFEITRSGDRDRSALRAGTVLGDDLPPAARR
jgi:class 3 adenylate cyclase